VKRHLEQLILTNHESWVDRTFNFHPGVNILVGLSDAGKSSILRAIRLVADNEPNKNKTDGNPVFKNDAASDKENASVQMIFADDISVSRIKGKVTNQYDLQIEDNKIQEFKAFASIIPDEINDAVSLNEVNIQKQKELPFLISQNSADRGRFFNQVAGLDNIDKSQKYANSKVLEAGREATTCEKEVDRVSAEINKLDFIPKLEQKVEKLEALGQDQTKLRQKIDQIQIMQDNWKRINVQLSKLPHASILISFEKKIKHTNVLIAQFDRKTIQLKTLENLHNKWNVLKSDISDVESVDIESLSENIKSTLELIQEYTERQRHLRRIKSYSESYALVLLSIEKAEKQLVRTEKEWEEIKPETCPLCGNKWNKK
jgi:exonuclease SbcC